MPASNNLILGRPRIHSLGAVPSSLHQKVEFPLGKAIVTIQGGRQPCFLPKKPSIPVLEIRKSTDEYTLSGFTFEEVSAIAVENTTREKNRPIL